MAVLDIESLLAPISEDTPCGDNLEYDSAYLSLETAARGKPEQVYGDKVFPGEEPDWRQVERSALELLRRTADLRLVVHLAQAQLNTVGFTGFADALSLMHGLLNQRWDHVFPLLEEDDDATLRVNAIAGIAQVPQQGDEGTILRAVRLAPLVASQNFGRFSLRDWQIATGELTPLADTGTPTTVADFEAACLETPLEELQATAEAVRRCIAMTIAIEDVVTERVGASQAADLSALVQALGEAERVLSAQLARRGVGAAPPAAAAAAEEPIRSSNGAAVAQPLTGEITSREDVIHMLDKVCEYFQRHEPSSPVPLLLERAKRLVDKDFVEILRDLAPDGIPQFEVISGINRQNGA